jgi:hypothetical protein
MLALEPCSFAERQVYASFRTYLAKMGFFLYPREFDCAGSDHPFVDLAGRMGAFYWAFEYKSESDSISRGLEQIRAYSQWFDYVVLVTEKLLDHSRSSLFWDLKNSGAGIWNYIPGSERCVEQVNPILQAPEAGNRRHVGSRFRALQNPRKRKSTSALIDGGQLHLCRFV